MRILVLNGSPKGSDSVTMQYVHYVERRFPDHEVAAVNVAQLSRALVAKGERFRALVEAVERADLVLWAFPLYILLVCSQYKRFIELAYDTELSQALSGKYAATLSTSIKYHDNLAHSYVRGVCGELGMQFLGSYSAAMHDLLNESERRRLESFAQGLFLAVEESRSVPAVSSPAPQAPRQYVPATATQPLSAEGRRVVILTDGGGENDNLARMVGRIAERFGPAAKVYDLWDVDIKGGCLGCCRCGPEYECAYTGKDGYIGFYNEVVRPADIIVFAGHLRARQLSWKWRQFFDRSFFNTHTPSLVGKQLCFVVSGPLSQLPEVPIVYQGWAELQQANLVGFVSDEPSEAAAIDDALDGLASAAAVAARMSYVAPQTFLGVGGMKVFRDEIWSGLRVVFQADHKAYRRMGAYDFPQKRVGKRMLVALAMLIMKIRPVRRKFAVMIKPNMTSRLARVVSNTAAASPPAASGLPVGAAGGGG